MPQETYEAMQRATAAISEWPCYHVSHSADGTGSYIGFSLLKMDMEKRIPGQTARVSA